ncbi:MAG: PA2169 family four-helix-bundle protein [Chthoniobacter sp.]|nr:PA2169 family four-helix-bundle protein [Chthoniobacter sp.]
MQSNADLRCSLNRLIQICKDGQEGFLTAAENVGDPETKKLFSEYSLQRSKYVGELQAMSHELGESDPENESSVPGAVHRGWMNLKGAVLSGDAHTILVECERGESHAVAEYEKSLKVELPAHLRELVSRQYAAILAAHHEVRMLADAGGPKWG